MAIKIREGAKLKAALKLLNVLQYEDKYHLAYCIYFIGLAICIVIGWISTIPFQTCPWYIGTISGILLWNGFYLIHGYSFVESQNVTIIERFGKYHRTIRAGWTLLCLPGIIDQLAKESILLTKTMEYIHTDSANDVEINFNCGSSAPIKGELWFKIEDPLFWHYRVGNPRKWLSGQTAAFIQPILEHRTLDEVLKSKRVINALFTQTCDSYDNEDITIINPDFDSDSVIEFQNCEKLSFHNFALSQIGVNITDLLIMDIEIPPKIRKIRKQELVAKLDKKSRKIMSSGYVDAIHEIKASYANHKNDVSTEDAERLYTEHKNREAFEKCGANVTIVGSDVKNLIGSLFTK